MTPPTNAIPSNEEIVDYIGEIRTDDPRQHPYETFPEPRRWPSYRGGPALDPMTEYEYRLSQADYDGDCQ